MSESHAAAKTAPKEIPLREELSSIIFLTFLYFLQGIPLGLSMGTMPFLLREHASYATLGWFSFAGYPFSLKVLWSPVVDAVYSRRVGRRRTWILPTQIAGGLLLLWMATQVDDWLAHASESVLLPTLCFFALTALFATQDIAVDGWALTMLSEQRVHLASACQSIGQNAGFFLSFTIFLALNSPAFSARIRGLYTADPVQESLVTLPGFMRWAGAAMLLCSVYLLVARSERQDRRRADAESGQVSGQVSVRETYARMLGVLKRPAVQRLLLLLLTAKFAFAAADGVAGLKLLERGLPKETIAMAAVVLFPFEFVFPMLVSRWSHSRRLLSPWLIGFPLRLLLCLLVALAVHWYPTPGEAPPLSFVALVLLLQLVNSLGMNAMFVSQCAFFARIADTSVGGSYMTLLNTAGNLGGMWPKFVVLQLVDRLTTECDEEDAKCSPRDGFFAVNAASVVFGIAWFVLVIVPLLRRLHRYESHEWKVAASPPAAASHEKQALLEHHKKNE